MAEADEAARGGQRLDPSRRRAVEGVYHFLDMGRTQYGDCIVARFDDRAILIDGGHPRDLEGQSGFLSIPDQLSKIFGHGAPFPITLAVVTHCHNDHIGCMPELIERGLIRPSFVLVSDPDHGFPPGARDNIPGLSGLGATDAGALRRTMAGLAEEDHSDLPDSELAPFLDQVLKLGQRYRKMVSDLERDGTPVFRWGVSPPERLRDIYDALAGTGFDVIGPSIRQLEACRDQIVEFASDSAEMLLGVLSTSRGDAGAEMDRATRLYRGLGDAQDAPILLDRRGQGSALNCQSIMIKLGHGDAKVLLTGDMQFADPEVTGIDADMENLLAQAVRAGPYRVVKTPHHTSYNGIDVTVWRKLGKPEILVHSGGSDDSAHPEPSMLEAFKRVDAEVLFARTDRNGLITVRPSTGGRAAVEVARGRVDDFTRNVRRRDLAKPEGLPSSVGAEAREGGPSQVVTARGEHIELLFIKVPYADGRVQVDGHDITISRPRSRETWGGVEQRERLTPESLSERRPADAAQRLANGRPLPKLLFISDRARLKDNIGEAETAKVISLVERDADLMDLASVADPRAAVQRRLAEGGHEGVVIIGGYDVAAPERVDVLDARLRGRVSPHAIRRDQDEFFVWSDDIWGDRDGDGQAEIPVSRIPDGRSPRLVLRALTAKGAATGAFGLCNVMRPFATDIYALVRGAAPPPLMSAETHYSDLKREDLAQAHLYFMLHGDDRDGGRFWGDDPNNGQLVEAVNVGSLPEDGVDVVFSGCCWGALSVLQRANRADVPFAPKTPEQSMALSSLMAGARAFIGCTGVHYSPDETGAFFGGPMHRAFWRALHERNLAPAPALFQARKDFLADMPHGMRSSLELAIERKIYKQFTCLGLGW